jgi:transketolase
MSKLEEMSVEELSINTIRTLSMDAIQKANSGHPGAPMALAPLAYLTWTRFMKHNPKNPKWINRDRFVLSNGHASMLLYSMLYLTGYDLSLDDIKNFRQWESKTPGHPEYAITPGAETTTGPLGQGVMNAVGMAIAEAHMAAVYNRPGFEIINHYTFTFCGDGDLMEGASHEAASLAGHLGLSKLIYLYDDNHISIEGDTALAYSDDVQKRFESYNWHVINVGDNANNLEVLSDAIDKAKSVKDKPSIIIVRSHIAYGSPNMQDTEAAHGSPLGEDEIKLTKKNYGWPEDEHFLVPQRTLDHMREIVGKGEKREKEWKEKFLAYKKEFPDLAAQLEASIADELPKGWDKDIPKFQPSDGPLATRQASGKVINAFASSIPWFVGGSADLSPSTNTLIKNSGYFSKDNYSNRNIAWGVREHVMCSAANGLALHGGIRPYTATFFVFTDYARPAIRIAALMHLPVIYVMTHDSVGLGEDGPTHQPVEQLASLRAMANLTIIRPADANETTYAWRAAMMRKNGPTMLVLSRQKLAIYDPKEVESAAGVLKGAYIISRENNKEPDVILMASGSEVEIILGAQSKLAEEGIQARCVSFPSWELFREQSESYQNEILPPEIKARVGIEAGSPMGWQEWIGDQGEIIGITTFGASAPYKEIYKQYGLTVENVVTKAKKSIATSR